MEEIIWEGEKLTKPELKKLCETHFECKNEDEQWNPDKNDKVISIVRQEDGNYKAFAKKNGVLIAVREGDPHSAFTRLLTHE